MVLKNFENKDYQGFEGIIGHFGLGFYSRNLWYFKVEIIFVYKGTLVVMVAQIETADKTARGTEIIFYRRGFIKFLEEVKLLGY
jgi:HSP90 family molecular chaperone